MSENAILPPGDYFLHVVGLVRERSLKRNELDWHRLDPDFQQQARTLESLSDAHEAIRDLLQMLSDGHSFLMPAAATTTFGAVDMAGWRLHWEEPLVIDVYPGSPAAQLQVRPGDRLLEVDGTAIDSSNWRGYFRDTLRSGGKILLQRAGGATERVVFGGGFYHANPVPRSRLTASGFGLLDLPGHMGDGSLPADRDYGAVVRSAIAELAKRGARAWIIDLRRCDGGNMWPILAGLVPLLGVGHYGSFVDVVNDVWWEWGFDGENLFSRQRDNGEVDYSVPVKPDSRSVPTSGRVAVLTSRVTSSSGEAVAISFLGVPGVRLFGESTGGLTSANNMHVLGDGSSLLLAETYEADRLDRVYQAGVDPDEEVRVDWTAVDSANDPVVIAAENWLARQLK